jgi:hypothetical protein
MPCSVSLSSPSTSSSGIRPHSRLACPGRSPLAVVLSRRRAVLAPPPVGLKVEKNGLSRAPADLENCSDSDEVGFTS